MRATDPARSFDDGRGDDARFPEHFQGNTTADDVDNRIHCPHFVEVDRTRRFAVDFAFGVCDALKHRDGFLFHPRRELALFDELFDCRKVAAVIMRMLMVVLMIRMGMMVAMLMRMLVTRFIMFVIACVVVMPF